MSDGRDIYIAIMVAAAHGRGLNLTTREVGRLSNDEAIRGAAVNGLDLDDWPDGGEPPDWHKIKPLRIGRIPQNLGCIAPEDRALPDPAGAGTTDGERS